jgi:hypothetical protein
MSKVNRGTDKDGNPILEDPTPEFEAQRLLDHANWEAQRNRTPPVTLQDVTKAVLVELGKMEQLAGLEILQTWIAEQDGN